MASFVDYSNSSDSSSDSDYSGKPHCLDFSYAMLDTLTLSQNLEAITCNTHRRNSEYYESMILCHNQLTIVPDSLAFFHNLKLLDLSANSLTCLPEAILMLNNLTSLIAKNNLIVDDGIPKNLGQLKTLKEVNVSGNCLTRFPEQFLELDNLKFLYAGRNQISEIPNNIGRLQKLRVLYFGGNRLTEIPAEVGQLNRLQALVLSDNHLESLPSTIAQLKKLKSLLLHNNQLTTLPPHIIALQELMELSLRENPLVVRFVRDLTYNPPTLLELAGRVIKLKDVPFHSWELPKHLATYLACAHQCVNPKCQGVYFDSRVEHVKFVDFCGKYRIPLLQYLCSPNCTNQPISSSDTDSDSDNGYRLRKVLLG